MRKLLLMLALLTVLLVVPASSIADRDVNDYGHNIFQNIYDSQFIDRNLPDPYIVHDYNGSSNSLERPSSFLLLGSLLMGLANFAQRKR